MAILHAKCTRCGGRVHRFGGRRRRCTRCGRTWSIRPKRRGRKPRRPQLSLVKAIIRDKYPARQLHRRHHCSYATLRRRISAATRRFVQLPGDYGLPPGDLVLVVDALWSILGGQLWVLYNLALKPVAANVAWFLDPYLGCGRENTANWQSALAAVDRSITERVKALVSDGLRAFPGIVRQHNWVHQLCHRHLLRSVERALGWFRRYPPDPWLRAPIYRILCNALETSDGRQADVLCDELAVLIGEHNCTRLLRRSVGEFLRQRNAFRAYRLHPELHLPTTTSMVESMHSQLRRAISTTNNPRSLWERAQAFIRLHPRWTCNGTDLTQK